MVGVAKLAGGVLKAFNRGLSGGKVLSKAPDALRAANAAGRFVDSPVGNYAFNTVSDAAFGALWGEDPIRAFQRSALANVGGTIGQKLGGAAMGKLGMNRATQEFIGGTFINPLSYSLTEMGAMKVMPEFYGLDAQGNYVGDNPQPQTETIPQLTPAEQQAVAYQQMAMAAQNPPGLSPVDRQAAQVDFYFDQQDKARRAQQALAKETYRRSLENQFAGMGGIDYGMLLTGIPTLEQQNQMYGGFR